MTRPNHKGASNNERSEMNDEAAARQLSQNPGNDPQKDGARIADINPPALKPVIHPLPTSSRQDELSFEQQQDITKILELYHANPSNSNKYRFELFAKINSIVAHHTKEAERLARIDELLWLLHLNKQVGMGLPIATINKRIAELAAPAIHKRDMEGSGKDE